MRETLLRIHLWVAVVLCVPLVLLGLSGSALVFDDRLDALLAPLPAATGAGPERDLDAIVRAAGAALPKGLRARTYLDRGDGIALVRFSGAGARVPQTEVAVDMRSLAVLRVRSAASGPLRFIHRLHGDMLLGAPGRKVVGGLGIAMLVLGVTGVAMWFRLRVFRVRPGARGFALFRDIHAMLGIWTLLAFVVVSATGVALAFPTHVGERGGGRAGARGMASGAASSAERPPVGRLAPLLSDPDGHVRALVVPLRGTSELVRAVHDGDLGFAWKIVVFLVGLSPAAFTVSGLLVWRARTR